MFQETELGQKIAKKAFKQQELLLREELLDLQLRLREDKSFPVLIDFSGVRGAGKGTSTNMLNKWMDSRWIITQGYGQLSDEERERPAYWRFWRDMPPKGQIGIYLSGRYSKPLLNYVYEKISEEEYLHQLKRINRFEKALADDGAMILKFWMHINQDVQKARLESLESDPLRNWRMSDEDWRHWEMYDRFIEAAEKLISQTNTGHAPWSIVDGQDLYYRSLRVGEIFRDNLARHLKKTQIRKKYEQELAAEGIDELAPMANGNGSQSHVSTIFDSMDLSKKLPKKSFHRELTFWQARLNELHQKAAAKKMSTIMVFEGPDAAGKGGAIRQITDAMDARYFKVYPFAAPTEEENAHHYLWRFWRCIPRSGRLTIFDRSWYGRLLVERIEGFATGDEWRRAFAEINDFEEQLVEDGIVLVKFWLQISKDEQSRRFEAREKTPHKRWKLTEEDWRNREKWDDYQLAGHDVIQQTSKVDTPWVLVEVNDKPYGRIKVIRSVCEALEATVAKK
jgi:polyphosphate:AMP phosphotransferase